MSSPNPAEKSGFFVSDIEEIRRRARQHIEKGAVTEADRGDRDTVIRVLNEALATELVCVLRYKRHHYMASGIHAQAVAEEFLEHANEEQQHADKIAERITQLDGEPDFNPDTLTRRSHSEYVPGESLVEMIREDLGPSASPSIPTKKSSAFSGITILPAAASWRRFSPTKRNTPRT